MSALALFADPKPPIPSGIDLRCCDVAEVLAEVRGASLVVADPAWAEYDPGSGGVQGGGRGWSANARPDEHYPTLSLDQIGDHLDAAATCAAPGARMAVWHCWPLLVEAIGLVAREKRTPKAKQWARVLSPPGWRVVSGGDWHKAGAVQGVGFHWLGHSEPVLLYVKAGATPYTDTMACTRSGYASEPGPHSAKPVGWQRQWLRRWTPPGALVLDLYAGLGTVAEACALEGRRYCGAEIDPERHRKALGLVALGGRA